MIKKKIGIDNNFALKEACKNNDIILTAKGVNSQQVSYVDSKGKEKILNSKFNAGDTVKVRAKVIEGNHERIKMYKGTVIRRQGGRVGEKFTFRRNSNGVDVEKTCPLNFPLIAKIEAVRNKRNVKLHYVERLKKPRIKKRQGILNKSKDIG